MAERLHFDKNARYGAAMVGVMFAAYLNIATGFDAFLQASNYAGTLGTDGPILDFVEFALIVLLYILSFALMPTSASRRLAAVTLACVVLFLWATIGIERGTGSIREPVEFWTFVVNQGMVTLIVSLGGWLIVRRRRWPAFIVLLIALIPPIVSRQLVLSAVTSGSYTLVTEAMVVIGGIGGAWLAVLIDRRVRSWQAARAQSVPKSKAEPSDASSTASASASRSAS